MTFTCYQCGQKTAKILSHRCEERDEDATDNRVCDERQGGPFVKVDIEDLGEADPDATPMYHRHTARG